MARRGMTSSDLSMLDLADFIRAQALDAELVSPGVPMPTVDAAAAALGVSPERIFKSILFVTRDGACVMAVASGKGRVDAKRLAAIARTEALRLASPELALRVTGYPAGGTPPIGHRERFPVVVDTRVAAQAWGWAGGGREELMVRIRSADIVRLNRAEVGDIVEGPRT